MVVFKKVKNKAFILNLPAELYDTYNLFAGHDTKGRTSGTDDEDAYLSAKASYGDEKAHQKLLDKGYIFDEELSDARHRVYGHEKNNTLIGYRGTKLDDAQDIDDDLGIATGNRKTAGFLESKEKARRAKEKYKKELVHAGHSLGGTKALESQKEHGGRAVVFNPGQGAIGDYTDQRVYVNRNDPISNRIYGPDVHIGVNHRNPFGVHDLDQFE